MSYQQSRSLKNRVMQPEGSPGNRNSSNQSRKNLNLTHQSHQFTPKINLPLIYIHFHRNSTISSCSTRTDRHTTTILQTKNTNERH